MYTEVSHKHTLLKNPLPVYTGEIITCTACKCSVMEADSEMKSQLIPNIPLDEGSENGMERRRGECN